MTEIDRAQLAALDASGMHNTGRMVFEYGEFDTVKTAQCGFKILSVLTSMPPKYRWHCERCELSVTTNSEVTPSCQKPITPHQLATQIGGSHYKDMAIQPLDYIMKNGLGFAEGNVVKYVSRWRVKGGVEDLRKARHYLDVLIEGEGYTP